MNIRLLAIITVFTMIWYELLAPWPKPVERDHSILYDLLASTPGAPSSTDVEDSHTYLPFVINLTCSYYVATNGDDSNSGNLSAPWKTLQHAADKALAGSEVCIRSGTYKGFTLSRPYLTFTSYPGESATVTGDGVNINTIKIRDTSGGSIRNLTVKDNLLPYGTGIKVENASNITLEGNLLRDNQGFGVVLKNVSNVIVENNDATHNGNAIEVRYGSAGVVLRNNHIYQNDRVVDSSRGGIGITFYRTTGPVTAENNLLWENRTSDPSDQEGVAFEVYAASNVAMTGNVMWENQTVLETGTDGAPCNNLTFTRNIAYRVNWQQGLILRCASNSLIAHNTFDSLDSFVFDLSHNHGSYGASIENLRIVNNIAIHGRVYTLDTFPLPDSVEIDYNLLYNPAGSPGEYGEYLAYVEGYGNTNLFSEFQAWTGYETHGVNADPLLLNLEVHDYHLKADSPAIDRGIVLNEPYIGIAPDLGRFEYVLNGAAVSLFSSSYDRCSINFETDRRGHVSKKAEEKLQGVLLEK